MTSRRIVEKLYVERVKRQFLGQCGGEAETCSKSRKAILRIAFLDFECVADKYVLDTGVRSCLR